MEKTVFMVKISYERLKLRILQRERKISECATCIKWKRDTDSIESEGKNDLTNCHLCHILLISTIIHPYLHI